MDNPCSPSSLQETNKISFVTSNKGKPLLTFGHYLFKCNKTTDTKRYWVCIERQCGAFIHTNLNDEFLLTSGDHTHVAGPDMLEMRALREKMKNRIINETTSITKIYDEEIAKACLSESTAATFPTVVEYRSNMSKARRRATPVIPTSCVFEIPMPYQKTLTQEQFLLMDFYVKRGKDRVVVFATVQQLQLLFNSETIFMDGTFSVAPVGFEQIFLMHVQHFGQETAVAMNEQFQPNRIVTDFETALLPAVRQEFPMAIHTGCLFHFIRSVHRKIISLRLGNDYSKTADIREQCKALMALSLMPISELIQNENARCEHLITQLNAGATPPKESGRTTAFQRRFETLKSRFDKNEINAKQLLHGFGLLLAGPKK
ncbi:unnamed protein product [Didymodactylos carnosus]|uniref:FLYWCH-type domain-containing protein n=1 Tax=Didymodactylos carnosus TaxID=1234261 RepID=A0A8S2E2J5_9BILA|nr:unnamed protein product [Didymodactylos carnosus]CAF3887327.1 unnamed protein product [Didymodactylos carnosus]